ncbi:MAG: hypothetical protein ACLR2G_02635 [Phascolarctobacterium faecium]
MLKMAVIRRYSQRIAKRGIYQCFGSPAAGAYGAPAEEVFLAHLSQENNLPSWPCKRWGILDANEVGADTKIYITSQENIVKIMIEEC